jgi:hypothetical protein
MLYVLDQVTPWDLTPEQEVPIVTEADWEEWPGNGPWFDLIARSALPPAVINLWIEEKMDVEATSIWIEQLSDELEWCSGAGLTLADVSIIVDASRSWERMHRAVG